MTKLTSPYSIAGPIPRQLDAVLSHWRDLRRGQADMPFSDDIDLVAIRPLCRELLVLDVFQLPERFRLSIADVGMPADQRDGVLGKFIDEVELTSPLDLLRSQASATLECGQPTVYRHVPCARSGEPYSRLLAPAWGEGQVRLLLGAVERGRRDDD